MKKLFGLSLSVFLAGFMLWLVGFIVFSLSALSYQPQNPNTKTDAIIALTGGNYRISTGMELMADGMAPQLFISGIFEHVGMDEIMHNWPQDKTQPDCCIVLGRKARSTVENASETAAWVYENNIKSLRLVTSNYHMRRALREFHNAMPDIKIIAHPVTKPDYLAHDYKFWELAFSEYHKTLYRAVAISLKPRSLQKQHASGTGE